MRSALCLLGIVGLVACADAPAEAPPQPSGPAAVAPAPVEAAMVTVDEAQVRVNGAAVATVAAIVEAHRAQPEGAFAPLQSALAAARAAHPGDDLVVVKARPETPGAVARSLATTAALAGYARVAFERANDRVVIQLASPSAVERRLVVRLAPKHAVSLAWREAELLSVVDLPWAEAFEGAAATVRAPAVAAKIAQQWPEQGAHRDPADRGQDRAIVEVDDDVDLGHVIAVVDAIAATTRDKQGARVPAFLTSLAGLTVEAKPASPKGPVIALGVAEVRGAAYPPEIVGRVVRQRAGALRACYADGLGRAPKLAGKLTLAFTIGKSGDVSKLTATQALPDKIVQQCVLDQLKTLSFPGPDAPVTVSLPITFERRD